MITIIPCLEVMKAVTDKNLQSGASEIRREAFSISNELMSLTNVDLLLEGNLFDRIKPRLNDNHITFFNSVYKIDNSAKGVLGYDVVKSITWVANSESESRRVIIITDNPKIYSAKKRRICVISPTDFISKYKRALLLCDSKVLSSLDDALIVVFFYEEML